MTIIDWRRGYWVMLALVLAACSTSFFSLSGIANGSRMFLSGRIVKQLVVFVLGAASLPILQGISIVFSLFFLILPNALYGTSVFALTNGLPTLFGCMVMQKCSMRQVRAVFFIGAICFLAHPVGCYAYFYPLVWIIPFLATYISGSVVARLCIGSFASHLLGSLFWLYAGRMPVSSVWNMLPPIVLWERCLMIVAMAVLCYVFSFFMYWFSHLFRYTAVKIQHFSAQ